MADHEGDIPAVQYFAYPYTSKMAITRRVWKGFQVSRDPLLLLRCNLMRDEVELTLLGRIDNNFQTPIPELAFGHAIFAQLKPATAE